jgi:hypothetical protein
MTDADDITRQRRPAEAAGGCAYCRLVGEADE